MTLPKHLREAGNALWKSENQNFDTSNDKECFLSGAEWLFQHLCELAEVFL